MQNWQTTGAKLLIIGVFGFVISGCSQHQTLSIAIEDYHHRLASVLDIEAVDVEFSAQLTFPSKSFLYRESQAISINFREFYSLPNCRLNTLIAERNTGLGKTQLPSQRFIYETELLRALKECISISDDPAIKTKLKEVLAQKQQLFSHTYANLIQASDEFLLSLSQASGFVSGDHTDGFQETRIALQYLLSLEGSADENREVDSQKLESSLKDLNQFRLFARIWRSQQLITQWFTVSNAWLVTHTSSLTCDNRSDQQTVQYLNNVFMLFFAQKIQPIAGQLNHYHYQLNPILEAFSQNVNLDESWREAIKQQISNGHHKYKRAMQEHVVVWQRLLKRCGMSPSAIAG